MREQIKNYLDSCRQQIITSKNLQKSAQCTLDEGFYIGFKAGLNNVIYNLEKILKDGDQDDKQNKH